MASNDRRITLSSSKQALADEVVLPWHMRGVLRVAPPGVGKPLVDEGTLEPVRLIAVEGVEVLPHFRQLSTISIQRIG